MTVFCLGLTGSIGMGKSTTAGVFKDYGIPVWDADAAVHRLYSKGGGGAEALAHEFPEAISEGIVSREILKQILAQNPGKLTILEQIVHPLVALDRQRFLGEAQSDLVVLDIPLLFEKGGHSECDATLLVTAPPDLQRARVLARPNMKSADFEFILSRQMPDREKRAKADHILETLSFETTQVYVSALIAHLRSRQV